MTTIARRTDTPAATAHSWLAAAERKRPSRFREPTAATPLPAEQVAIPAPRGVRWGQGPLLDTITRQCAMDPRDLRRWRRN